MTEWTLCCDENSLRMPYNRHDSHVLEQFPFNIRIYMMRIMYEFNTASDAMKILSENILIATATAAYIAENKV